MNAAHNSAMPWQYQRTNWHRAEFTPALAISRKLEVCGQLQWNLKVQAKAVAPESRQVWPSTLTGS